ncbi:MAG: anthranilate synthase component I family protein [Gaiellaceae bacterium MAG52_C11]|nr:anthranilate synthase component I family protein [Candidatus Gaiellasilicea maunaloa]
MERAEITTDLLTPLGAYLRLRAAAGASFLLESVEQGRLGRHSFLGSGSRVVSVEEAEALDEPVVGYLAYDHVAKLEPTVPLPAAGADVPESRFVVADTLVRFDHGSGTATVLAGDRDEIAQRLEKELVFQKHKVRSPAGRTRRFPERAEYEAGVRRIQEHIRAGDAYQVVLSQRAERPTGASALELYRALRRINPSPYLFLLELDGLALIGSSPETLVKCEQGRASLNPIAGTTHPGEGDAERLLASEKDRAEHVMLVDLGRNDLSRVCRAGSVRVERFLEPERFSHVTHLVSEVRGELRDGIAPFDVLRACFPAGTVSGAPKVRAMQIVSELEGHRRGPYAGAVGYALPGRPGEGGTLDTCIAIRTILLHDGVARLQAGAGIVADSDPGAEHEECLNKLAALEAAIDLAEAEFAPGSR